MAGMYYGSYSLPTYVTIWSGDAFIKTTIIPFIMMVLINYGILMKSLKLSPLKFMKRDIKKVKKNKKTLVLHRLGFFSQFRLSVILNNLSGYITLFVGVLFAIILLMFGMDMHPVLDHYQDIVVNNMTAKYQYILNTPESVDTTAIEQVFQTIPQEFRDSFLSLIDDQYDEIIEKAIAYHSLYKIPNNLEPSLLKQVLLIRDSDKLDNFRVKNIESIQTLFSISDTAFYSQRVSQNILKDIENHTLILKENRHNEVDMWVSYMAFVFDLNFKSSYLFIRENDYIHRNMERLHFTGNLKEDMLFVEKTCQSYIEEKCK